MHPSHPSHCLFLTHHLSMQKRRSITTHQLCIRLLLEEHFTQTYCSLELLLVPNWKEVFI